MSILMDSGTERVKLYRKKKKSKWSKLYKFEIYRWCCLFFTESADYMFKLQRHDYK